MAALYIENAAIRGPPGLSPKAIHALSFKGISVKGRMLCKRISKSRKFAALKIHTSRLLYCLIIAHAERHGRVEADTDMIKTNMFPLITISARQITESLKELVTVGLIVLYENQGDHYAQVVSPEKPTTFDRESTRNDLPGLDDPNSTLIEYGEKAVVAKKKAPSTPAAPKAAPAFVSTAPGHREGTKLHLDHVWLKDREYDDLVIGMGEANTKKYIDSLNGAATNKPAMFKTYSTHYITVMNWAKSDGVDISAYVIAEKKKLQPAAAVSKEVDLQCVECEKPFKGLTGQVICPECTGVTV